MPWTLASEVERIRQWPGVGLWPPPSQVGVYVDLSIMGQLAEIRAKTGAPMPPASEGNAVGQLAAIRSYLGIPPP